MTVNIETNVPLCEYTTLGVGGTAQHFAEVSDEQELLEALTYARDNDLITYVLGGGSNVLVPDAGVAGLVIKNAIGGVSISDGGTLVTAGAGVTFDDLVQRSVEDGLWGLENLSAIPGTVGATPIQNVGAYGVEVGELVSMVRAYDMKERTFVSIPKSDCQFGYRDSRFKRERHRYIVTEVTYQLDRDPKPRISYRDLASWFEGKPTATLADIRKAVIAIRSKKFPDWKVVGTAGSFFKNPIVREVEAASLRERYTELPLFPTSDGEVKVALGWVLEHVLKLKGITRGHVGTFSGQALVLVTYDGATASEVSAFADSIAAEVYGATGVRIEREVILFGT